MMRVHTGDVHVARSRATEPSTPLGRHCTSLQLCSHNVTADRRWQYPLSSAQFCGNEL